MVGALDLAPYESIDLLVGLLLVELIEIEVLMFPLEGPARDQLRKEYGVETDYLRIRAFPLMT